MTLIENAIEKADRRPVKKIDWNELNRVLPGQKRALKKAVATGDPETVARTIKEAIAKWDEIGCWPDDWAHWQRTLDDMLPWNRQVDIRDL